ncbi:MAG: hypothetical protein J6T10_18555 [Methanobrevibacter sp.]|nr:hypothetical protein [Methanobrevibacter sp.]
MKFLNTDVWGFKHALRGMRNPMNSWNKSDSGYAIKDYELHDGEEKIIYDEDVFGIGSNDIGLMQRLINGGPEHRKFMRQIMVSIDITAPLYWWKEFDTYKIGTTANSTSTMHKLASNPITIEDFEMDDFKKVKVYDKEPYNYDTYTDEIWESIIEICETLRKRFIETKDKKYWKELIRILPESYLQTRTVTMNYENLYSIVRQRKGHKLTEWDQFIDWVHTLPYSSELIFIE